jgi:hypothetical protein
MRHSRDGSKEEGRLEGGRHERIMIRKTRERGDLSMKKREKDDERWVISEENENASLAMKARRAI